MTSSPHFRIRIAPEQSLLHVDVTLHVHDGDTFFLPVWIPGSYLIREFERAIQDLTLTSLSPTKVRLERLNKAAWRIHADGPTDVCLRYDIYGHELSVRSAHIDPTHAFFNGANVCVCLERLRTSPHRVSIEAPDDWTSFVSLPHEGQTFVAEDYVHLADTAFEIGPHPHHEFDVDGIRHRMIFWGSEGLPLQLPALEEDTRAIIQQNRDTFGRPLPYERYDIIFHITPEVRGGLEHRDSTTLATPWHFFESEEGYLDMLTLIAHEHFHAYNGRRLAPASLEHINFREENYTTELWVIEGFTSYFDELNTYKAGKMTYAQWLDRTAKALTRLHQTYGRLRQPLTEASFDAWIRLYRPYEHTRNQTVSYYLKGSLVAMAMDLRMQQVTEGARGLKDVLQELWAQWADKGIHYTIDSVLKIVRTCTDERIAQEFRDWITGTKEPPYRELLEQRGVIWEEVTSDPPVIGATFDLGGSSPVVASIDEHCAHAFRELLPGDELVAIDGRRVRSATLSARLKAIVGDEPTQHRWTVFQLERLREIEVTLVKQKEIRLREPAQ